MAGEFLNPSDFDDFDFNAGSFVAGSNSILPGVMDELVQFWQKGDHQEELVVGDTPPGPPSGVAALPGCSPRFVAGTGGDSVCENTLENASRVKLVPMKSFAGGFRAASRIVNDLKDQTLMHKQTAIVSGPATSVGQGRRALRSGKRVVSARVCASGFQRGAQSRSFSDNFEPHRLHRCLILVFCVHVLYLVLLVAFVRRFCLVCLHAVSVVVVRWTDRMCHGAGSVWRMHVMANSGSDHIDRNSWKHGPEVSGGTKALNQCSGYKDGRSFVDTVVGGAALAQYLRGAPEGTKVEAWEGRISTCSRPASWDVSVAEGCKVTV